MCNSNEDDGCMERTSKLLSPGTLCRKCDQPARVVLQIRDAYCRECFLAFCNHKFRALLGKRRVFPGTEPRPTLLAFSGSHASLTLLQLLKEAVDPSQAQRRLMVLPSILYIDEGAVVGEKVSTREDQVLRVLKAVTDSGFPCHVVSLHLDHAENHPAPRLASTEAGNVDTTHDEKVRALLTALPDLSSQLDMLLRVRQNVLACAARDLGVQTVLLADDATSLACRILASMALGRGAHVPLETGFQDGREDSVTFLRPLRDFTSKEVAFFSRFHNLEAIYITSLISQTAVEGSIQRLTEDFVVSLQRDFPSTVSTIYRTGDKLNTPSSSQGLCGLCRGPLDTAPRPCGALEATEFSRSLSATPANSQCCRDSGDTARGCQGECAGTTPRAVRVEQLLPALCYSCRLLARALNSPDVLPQTLLERLREDAVLAEMRGQIQDFLLE